MSENAENLESTPVKQVAVIDMGTTAVRMTIAEVDDADNLRILDTLQQSVDFGRDTFLRGSIRRETIEQCVSIMRNYCSVLDEYGIHDKANVRAVATTAIREASNRQSFLDRIFMASGIEVEVIDEAEVTRLNYRSLRPVLSEVSGRGEESLVVVEIGAGSTEVLVFENGAVVFAHTYRLGAMRLMALLKRYKVEEKNKRQFFEEQINQLFAPLYDLHLLHEDSQILALGSEMAFASRQINSNHANEKVSTLQRDKFAKLVTQLLEQPADRLVRDHHMSIPESETMAPTLLAYQRLLDVAGVPTLMYTHTSMRIGLLSELVHEGRWDDEFIHQILESARSLGEKYDYDEPHCKHTAQLALEIFDHLQPDHHLGSRFRVILNVAALLHEIGYFINNRSMHKHSAYLISHSEIFGLGKDDTRLVGQVARYHRRAIPRSSHTDWSGMPRSERLAVSQMAAILRVADALDRAHNQHVGHIRCVRNKKQLVIEISNVGDLSMNRLALKEKGPLFEDVYGLEVVLKGMENG